MVVDVWLCAPMSIALDLQHESLAYTANFRRPPFELWGGGGGGVVRALYDALSPYNITLQQIQLSPSLSTAGDAVVTVRLRQTVLKFSYEKIEVSFNEFSESEFQAIPKFLNAATGWLTQDAPRATFASHYVQYFSHSALKDKPVDEFLLGLNPKPILSEGINLGGGVIFNHVVPSKNWIVQLTIDRSQFIAGALFIGLSIRVESPKVEYDSLLVEGRELFGKAIAQCGLSLPELEK